MKIIPIKRALLSVSDKQSIVDFAKKLIALGVDILSTGGTSQALQAAGIPHRLVEEVTELPSMLNGRVKTLHPAIHGGILGRRDIDAEEARKHHLQWIDLVVVNFYPFEATVTEAMGMDEAVEYIDIGGPTMLRAAAKNLAWVGAVVDPADYEAVSKELEEQGGLTLAMRTYLAGKVFATTTAYDAAIHHYFANREPKTDTSSTRLCLQLDKHATLRYGENPHQKASAYRFKQANAGILSATQHQGKALSYNNILDAEAAWHCIREFSAPACVIVKHANPCGAASAETIEVAYHRAYAADALSAFGGVIALNRPCTQAIAEAIADIFMEIVMAPSYSQEALDILAKKTNLRVLALPIEAINAEQEMKFITGGVLIQEKDHEQINANDLVCVTSKTPDPSAIDEMLFAWKVLKHIKSNGILITKNKTTLGIGAGHVSRIDAVDTAIRKAGEQTANSVLASDAFFPFKDSIERIAQTSVRLIIQPGGSVRDDEVIAACNAHGIAMVFTGKRCFRH